MRPPIPSPTGDFDSSKRKAEELLLQGVSVSYQPSLATLLRRSLKEMFAGPMNVLALAVIVSLFTLSCNVTPLQMVAIWLASFCVLSAYALFLVVLFSLRQLKRQLTITMTRTGCVRRYVARNPEIAWTRVLRIANWAGDTLIVTFANATFIPREAFRSSEETHEFVQIARELHKTRGKSWRDEWKGKTFGKSVTNS